MKKILFTLLLLFFPYTSFAQLDVYLSTQNLPYGKDVWTSANYPDNGSSEIQVKHYFYREDIPSTYPVADISSLIDTLFPSLTPVEKQDRANSLIAFDTQNFSQYLAVAVSPNTESDIADTESLGYLLTPFESTFQSCGMNLSERETEARNLIDDIYNGLYSDVDEIEYSAIASPFGDCIIPFPDARRGSTIIANSFPSNKLAAQSLAGSPLRFGALLEDSVDLFSLSGIDINGSYQGVQDNNLLDLHSTRVEQDRNFLKESGGTKILYIHQNHYVNPFIDTTVTGNNTVGYTIGLNFYDTTHPLFIQSTDSEEKRTLFPWKEVREGVYIKTLIQDDTFDLIGGIYVPKQSVGATTYYAILYNYDTTPPECPSTLFSHENAGKENFILSAYPWFRDSKYGYFLCSDDESGCFCDSASIGCFSRTQAAIPEDITYILSIPQEIPHAGTFQYTFQNTAGLSQVCSSPVAQKLFYDRVSPDVHITLPGIPENTLVREYVSNNGVLYDGREIADKKFYHIKNDISFQADENLDIQLQLYDPYDATKTQEGVSGLSSYTVRISELESGNWIQKIEQVDSFGDYNPLGTIGAQDAYTIDFQTLENIEDIITQIGRYQVYVDFQDAAGNESRVIFYFDITPANIDVGLSTLATIERNTLYADNTSSYIYTLTLKDKYSNPIAGKSISDITQSCVSVPNCSELRLDMTGVSPSGEQALKIYNIDSTSNIDGEVHFSVRSLVPGVFSESFIVDVAAPVNSFRFSGQNNIFLAPFIGTLESKVGSDWVSDILPINQLSDYRVFVEDTRSLGNIWTLSDFSLNLKARHPDTDFVLSGLLVPGINGVYFPGTFTSSLAPAEQHKTLLEIVDGVTPGVEISYLIATKTVKYYLSLDELSQEILQLGNTKELQNPVKIIGNMQGVGNTHNLTERQNFTDISTYGLRNILRKNIGTNINTRVNNTTIGGVKYIDKTSDSNKEYTLESNPSFETLVVRNGNIHIKNDFNTSGKVIGLVSYIDSGYNKETGFEDVGNIYVEPEVKTINAFIYADGGLISTESGNPVSGDVATRNSILQNQLSIIGSLFTRNTLAGGRQFAGEYMLPGGEKTTDQSLATQYDLYYTRRGNNQCTMDAYGFCDTPEYLIIEYDTRVSSSPPKLFQTQ